MIIDDELEVDWTWFALICNFVYLLCYFLFWLKWDARWVFLTSSPYRHKKYTRASIWYVVCPERMSFGRSKTPTKSVDSALVLDWFAVLIDSLFRMTFCAKWIDMSWLLWFSVLDVFMKVKDGLIIFLTRYNTSWSDIISHMKSSLKVYSRIWKVVLVCVVISVTDLTSLLNVFVWARKWF